MDANTGCRSPGELEITRSTSDVAVCCSRASFRSRVSRATSASWIGADEGAFFDASRRFVFSASRPRALDALPLALERLFIGFPRRLRGIVAGRRATLEVAALGWAASLASLQFVMARLPRRLLRVRWERCRGFSFVPASPRTCASRQGNSRLAAIRRVKPAVSKPRGKTVKLC